MKIVPEPTQGAYYIVKDNTGRTISQGSFEMCQKVVAGELGSFCNTADLFADGAPVDSAQKC